MNQKPTYRFEIKSRRTGKKMKHYCNKEGHGFYGSQYVELTDERMKDIALGMVMTLMNDRNLFVEVYKLNERGEYDLIHTQF